MLFVRTSADLLDALDELTEKARSKHPHRSISRSDMARELLYQTLRQRGVIKK